LLVAVVVVVMIAIVCFLDYRTPLRPEYLLAFPALVEL